MKFQQLKIGQKFEYEGNTYVKCSPLIASHAETGEQKLIPRYAAIIVTDTALPAENKKPARNLNFDQVRIAFDKFYDHYLDLLEKIKPEIETHTLESMQNRLAKARQQFFNELGLQDKPGNKP